MLTMTGLTKTYRTDTVETIKQMHEGRIRVFIGMGGNFLSATPDTEFTAKALQRCRLTPKSAPARFARTRIGITVFGLL